MDGNTIVVMCMALVVIVFALIACERPPWVGKTFNFLLLAGGTVLALWLLLSGFRWLWFHPAF